MRLHRRLLLISLLLSPTVHAETPLKYLRPVPPITHHCIQTCSDEEARCSARTTLPGRQCDDAMRIYVHRCDPQLLNSIVLDELEEKRNTPERGEAYQNGIAGS